MKSVIPALRKLRQEDCCKFRTNLGYIVGRTGSRQKDWERLVALGAFAGAVPPMGCLRLTLGETPRNVTVPRASGSEASG